MNDSNRPEFDPDDPRLTAFVLGELNEADRAGVERQLAADGALREAADVLRETAEQMRTALTREPAVPLSAEQRAAIAALADSPLPAVSRANVPRRPRWGRWLAATAGLALVATFAVIGYERSQSQENANYFAALKFKIVGDRIGQPLEKPADDTFADVAERWSSQTNPDTPQELATNPPAEEIGRDQRVVSLEERGRIASTNSASVVHDPAAREYTVATRSKEAKPENRELGERSDRLSILSAPDAKGLESEAERQTRIKLKTSNGQTSKLFKPGTKSVEDLAQLNKAEGYRRESVTESKPRADSLTDFAITESIPSAETYAPIVENEFLTPDKQPLSTFSIDVDTASYSNMRRFVRQGQMPPPDAVRVEELLNYFRYDYPQPVDGTPFAVALDHGPCPWQPRHELVRIGLKGKEIDRGKRPASNVVFLVDTSGSMAPANKLPLVQQSLKMLAESMTTNDRIAIVTYAGTAGLALASTTGDNQQAIMTVIDSLHAGGSTNGEAGIHLAYKLAGEHFVEGGTNRVILCTDGDFNVGVSGDDELVRIIQEKAKSHVFLSIFGFGMGNLKDAKLEQLADKGNGHYGYIDDQREARKVFVEELTGTLHTIAKDVKIQVEFNPRHVAAYRLIGYENRALAAQDFNDDKKDAGEIGAGHTVTALYEIVPIGVPFAAQPAVVDPLKYQQPEKQPVDVAHASKAAGGSNSPEWLTVKLRYKQPDADQSVKLEVPLTCRTTNRPKPRPDFDWAAAVAEFGLLLRHSTHRGSANFAQVLELAETGLANDKGGYRAEFVELVKAVRQMPQAKSYEQPVPVKSGER